MSRIKKTASMAKPEAVPTTEWKGAGELAGGAAAV
jgi:hypothetical protein